MNLEEKVKNLINEKNGKWDIGCIQNPNILNDLLCEYIKTLSSISGLTEDFILQKLRNELEVLRFGDFTSQDNFLYDGINVNSYDFKNKYRNNGGFGAITLDTVNGKKAVYVFDGSGNYYGINLSDLNDIKHTLYHELTHVMEESLVDNKGIINLQNNSAIVTGNCSPHKEFEQYLNERNEKQIYTKGIVTHEFKNSGDKIYHNMISEGCTELIARLILEKNNIPIPHSNRYIEYITMAKILFDYYGENALKDYLTDSSKLINFFINEKIADTNLLFYADHFKDFCNDTIRNSSVQTSKSDVNEFYEYLQGKKTKEELLNGKNQALKAIIEKIINYKQNIEQYIFDKKVESILSDKINDKELVSQYLYVFEYILNMYKNNGIDLYKTASSYIDATKNGDMYQLNTKLNINQVKEIAFDFFSKLNCGAEIKKTIEEDINKNKIHFDNKNPNCSASFDGKNHNVYLTNYGDLRDLYTVAHEYTHAFDSLSGHKITRRLTSETNAQCMERLLDSYLLSLSDNDLSKYNIDRKTLEEDILDRNIATFYNRFGLIEQIIQNKNKTKNMGYIFAQIYSTEFSKLSFDKQINLIDSMIKNTREDNFDDYLSSMPCDLTINNSNRNQILFSNLKDLMDKLSKKTNFDVELENKGKNI